MSVKLQKPAEANRSSDVHSSINKKTEYPVLIITKVYKIDHFPL